MLKPFFTALGVAERAAPLDYVRRIQEVASGEDADNAEVRERVQTLYLRLWQFLSRFPEQRHARLRESFQEKSLIFAPNPEPRWWRADEVFWEKEDVVFGNARGYLSEHYPEMLKPFFTALGVSERAAPSDYVRRIQEVASGEDANDAEVRERVQTLYRRLWQSLQEGENWTEDEEWEQVREGECWLGKLGDEWGFFHTKKLVWNNHSYFAELFEGEVPFWAFPDDLLELARYLDVKGCSQAETIFHPLGARESDELWSEKVRNLRRYIHDFLNSPLLCEDADSSRLHEEGKSAQVLDWVSVCRTRGLEVTYKLKGSSVTGQANPRQSFLESKDQEATLWLSSEAAEAKYAQLIGAALQDYFAVKQLREFVKDLLTAGDRSSVLADWGQEGFQTDLSASPLGPDSEDVEEPAETPDATGNGYADPATTEVAPENPHIKETEEPQDRYVDPATTEDESEPGMEKPQTNTRKPSSFGGHRNRQQSTSSGSSGGGHNGRGGGGESEQHRNLKESLANNPTPLGEGLRKGDTEYRFTSGDKADILLEDNSGNPVTVEVETYIPSQNYVGVWQAVKYKHLAAVKYGIPCEQVRSILAAPRIPNDVKQECERLGIEPIEVP